MSISIPRAPFKLIDENFGTTLQKAAEDLGLFVDIDVNKEITGAEIKALATKYPTITECKFFMSDYVSDMEKLADTFGIGKENVHIVGSDDVETFKNGLNIIDMILSALSILPINKMDKVRKGISVIANTIRKFIPSIKDVGALLAKAPALTKYAPAFEKFGDAIDKALSLVSSGDPKEAIDLVKEAIHEIRKIDLTEIRKEANKNHIALTGEVVDVNKDNASNNKSKKKNVNNNKSAIDVDSKDVVDVVDKNTNTNNDIADNIAYRQYQQHPLIDSGTIDNQMQIPDFMNPDLNPTEGSNGYVPEFLAEQPVIPSANPGAIIFAPVQQTYQENTKFSWVRSIVEIANRVGYMLDIDSIPNNIDPKILFVRVFKNNEYLYNKSFVIDIGSVIDGRYGIWPCAVSNGQYAPLEMCNVAYHLNGRDGKLNEKFIEAIFMYGFSGLDKKFADQHILYKERMLITNRKVDMISLPSAFLDKVQRNIIKGACIRAAGNLEPRFRFESVDPKTLTFVLTNIGVPDYLFGPVSPRQPRRILCYPAKDENGNYIKVNQEGKGDDIRFTFRDI